VPKRHEASGAYFIYALSTTNQVKAAAWMPARNPLKQLQWDVMSISRVLKALVTPKESKAAAQALGGPVMIAQGLYTQVRRDVWDSFGFLRFLCINLAILNLLPIPVLDGSIILFSFIELVTRRKLSGKFINIITRLFMYLLIAAMLFLVYRDSLRSWRLHRASKAASAEEAAK
jgi:RIP metalloprotease RseP